MTNEETQKQLSDTMQILEDFFFVKYENAELIYENEGHDGWYYMSEKTAKKLKRQLIKFKTK